MWTASQFAERFGLRVETQDIDLVHSGSGGWLELKPEPGFSGSIPVARILRRRGVSVLVGKPVVEKLLIQKPARVYAEHIDEALEGELLACKVRMSVLPAAAAAE